MDFFIEYFIANFIVLALELLIFLLLRFKSKISNVDFRPLYLTLFSILLCTALAKMETYVMEDSSKYYTRLTLSILCYWLRPAYCLGLIYVIISDAKKRFLATIPEIINIVVMGLAFVPKIGPLVISYGPQFNFSRGPLYFTVFIISFFYIFFFVYLVIFKVREKMAKESLLLLVCSILVIASTALECSELSENATAITVLISCLIYYLIMYIQLTSTDPLTGLYNRENYYQDLKIKNLTAVASIDMNGLKEMNDSKGHQAGDSALASIAQVIKNKLKYSSRAYRVGGDEFIILFRKTDEENLKYICDEIKSSVEKNGLAVSLGYAMTSERPIEETIALSDERMYADKTEYYLRTGRDRRKN